MASSWTASEDAVLAVDPIHAQMLADFLFCKASRQRSRQDVLRNITDKGRIEKRERNRISLSRRKARVLVDMHTLKRRKVLVRGKILLRPQYPLPRTRCWDWVIHDGDVHYACNGASFSHYQKIDAYVHNITGEGQPIKAIGIGTVRFTAMRALESENVCEIVLHDVPHLHRMPCNGISQSKLEAEETSMTVWKTANDVQVAEPTGAWIFCGTREGDLHRVAMYESAGRESTLDAGLRLEDVSVSASDLERGAILGEAGRMIDAVQVKKGLEVGVGPHTKVEC